MNLTCHLRQGTYLLVRILSVFLVSMLGYLADSALVETTVAPKTEAKPQNDDKSGMIKGMAAGFGGFIGCLVLICGLWCCCCASDDSKCCCKTEKPAVKAHAPGRKLAVERGKIGPSPAQSVTSWSGNQ